MRRQIVAGNWKMNKSFQEAEDLFNDLCEVIDQQGITKNTEIIICPPALYLEMALDFTQESSFSIGAQDVSMHDGGAYTGDISASMLASMQVEYSILGHSERRKYHGETDDQIAQKVEAVLRNELTPIVCCGEVLEEREAGKHLEVIRRQIEIALFRLDPLDFAKVIIAYEPVWAIGTGKTATPEQAQEIHAFIRELIQEKYGKELAKKTPILYGGSCNAKNAKELFAQPDVDGGLIGGASLVAADFIAIANAF